MHAADGHGADTAPATDDAGFDAGTYGRSFADVYDRWYPAQDSTQVAVSRLVDLAGPRGRVLELGVGTGRLAVPLADAGHDVTGLDASPEMLAALEDKVVASGAGERGRLIPLLGDVGSPQDWPEGPFELVVAAFNLVFNLADAGAQVRCFAEAARVLAPGGAFVVEAFLPAPMEQRERRLEVREVTASGVVLIATDSDPGTGVVTGQHIELVDGEPVRLRPWRIRVVDPAGLDELAAGAGLELAERHGDWSGTPFDPHGTAHVSVYRRA